MKGIPVKMSRFLAAATCAALLAAGVPTAAHAAASVHEGDFTVPNGTTYVGDLRVRGDVIVGAGATVSGNLIVTGDVRLNGGSVVTRDVRVADGTISIARATVLGDVRQTGAGGVAIYQGSDIRGAVSEQGDGNLSVSGDVRGQIAEAGAGALNVRGTVGGNAKEEGSGNVLILGTVHGRVAEYDGGYVVVEIDRTTGATGTTGDVLEHDLGALVVRGRVNGTARELDGGSVTIGRTAVVTGNVVESGDGDVLVQSGAQIGGTVLETP